MLAGSEHALKGDRISWSATDNCLNR